MISLDQSYVENFVKKQAELKKEVPAILMQHADLMREYRQGDSAYTHSDDLRSYRAGAAYHESLTKRFAAAIDAATTVDDKALLLKIIDNYTAPNRVDIVSAVWHPTLTGHVSGYHSIDKFIDEIGIDNLPKTLGDMNALSKDLLRIAKDIFARYGCYRLVYTAVPYAKLRELADYSRVAHNAYLVAPDILERLEALFSAEALIAKKDVFKAFFSWTRNVAPYIHKTPETVSVDLSSVRAFEGFRTLTVNATLDYFSVIIPPDVF